MKKVNIMALIEKTNTLIVGYELIDNDHDEFISLSNKLDSASNADFPALFQQLHEHTEQHFDREIMVQVNGTLPRT
jgi:hemerythrin